MLSLTEEQIDDLSKIVHQANKAFCETEDNFSQKSWEETPEDIKQITRNGVKVIVEKPDITPEELHENWVNDKLTDGWVFGEEKDPYKKTHPCIVPYDQLSQTDRFKDTLFHVIVKSYIDFVK